jgi:adenylosuccinate synthase
MPADLTTAKSITPIYEEMPGWSGSVIGARRVEEFPAEARAYLDRLAEVSGCPVGIASNGAEREAIVMIPGSPLDHLVP